MGPLGAMMSLLCKGASSTYLIMTTLVQTLRNSHDWAVKRIKRVSNKNIDDAFAIEQEFNEWLDTSIDEYEILSLEYIGGKYAD